MFSSGNIFLGVILASFIHLIAIPLIELIPQRSLEEEEEPRIILDLTRKVDTLSPIIEQKILKPQINNNTQEQQIVEEIPPLKQMKKVQEFEKQIISPLPKNFNENIENKITIPVKPTKNNINKIFTTPIKPKNPKIILEKVLDPINKPIYTKSGPKINSPTKQKLSEENIPIIQDSLPHLPQKELLIEKTNEIDENILKKYKNSLTAKIQEFASKNYPIRYKKRTVRHTIHIIFKLKVDGSLEYIKFGPDTSSSAPEDLKNAARKAVEKNAPYKNEEILKQKNEFSILIRYKIN